MKHLRWIVKGICFTGLLLAITLILNSAFSTTEDYRNYHWMAGFYEERDNSLDAVYLGSSTTYAFWAAPIAFERYGITVYPLTTSAQPVEAAEYLIREARKTQPDAVYLVNLNHIVVQEENFSTTQLHYLTDYMPLSLNKIQMVNQLGDYGGYGTKDRLEFLFPLIRYHTRWNRLTEKDFTYELNGIKGACYYNLFLRQTHDVTHRAKFSEELTELPDTLTDSLTRLFAYIRENDVKTVFVLSPQCMYKYDRLAQFNAAAKMVTDNGFPLVNMMDESTWHEVGMNASRDYYNFMHANIHGCIKTTDYLARYLVEHYDLSDKRGDPAYADWTKSVATFNDLIAPYVPDVERLEGIDGSLKAPSLSLTADAAARTLSWDPVEGADGYRVYRKIRTVENGKKVGSAWQKLYTVTADTLTCADRKVRKKGETYIYTVLPYRLDENGNKIWGEYDLDGIHG